MKKNQVKKICLRCGKTFFIKVSRALRGRGKYCSYECKYPKKIRKICIRCGKEFFVLPCEAKIGVGKYCSRDCMYPEKNIERICPVCGKIFYVVPSLAKIGKGIYCSDKCRHPDKPQMKKCLNCEKEFRVIPYRLKRNYGKFCSRKCKGDYLKKGKIVFCINCEKEFYAKALQLRQSKKHFCSNECKFEYQRGKQSPGWKNGKQTGRCLLCGKTFEFYATQRIQKFCSKKCTIIFLRGKDHPNWRGGISREPYAFNFDEELKDLIRRRDNYICQICGRDQSNLIGYHKKPPVHHIDYNKQNSDPKNLITLCKYCHHKTGCNRETWIYYFRKLDEMPKLSMQ